MGDKKEEQIKIIEMMNDARKDLEAKYARLKAQLGEEEIEEADETISEDVVEGAAVESSPAESDQPTENMSDNTSDNKAVKKVPKKSEKKVEKKPAAPIKKVVRKKVRSEKESAEKERIRKEMGSVQVQINYVKAAIENCEMQLQKAKEKEEQKKIENVMKGVMLVGAYIENKRVVAEKEEKLNDEINLFIVKKDYATTLQESVKEIFTEKKFKYITEDKVQEILNNEEFKKMAQEDPNKLKRDEKDIKMEYENVMIRALSYINEEVGDDFRENEEKFKKVMSLENGFEDAFRVLRTDKRFKGDDKENYWKEKRQRYTKDIEQYANEEEKEFFGRLLADIDEVAKETRQLQNEFIIGRASFRKGNGYTKRLIEKETDIYNRIIAFRDQKHKELLSKAANGEDPTRPTVMFQIALEFEFPIKKQLGRDTVLQKNNALREQMEMWYVYERIPKEERQLPIKWVSTKAENEVKAWSKLQRMKRMIVGRGDYLANLSDWVLENADALLERAKKEEPLTKDEEKKMIQQIASVVLYQVVYDESVKKLEGEESYLYKVKRAGVGISSTREYAELAQKLSETKEFKKEFSKYMKNADFKEQTIKFLADDAEKNFAKAFTGKGTEHRRMSTVVEGDGRPIVPRRVPQRRPNN